MIDDDREECAHNDAWFGAAIESMIVGLEDSSGPADDIETLARALHLSDDAIDAIGANLAQEVHQQAEDFPIGLLLSWAYAMGAYCGCSVAFHQADEVTADQKAGMRSRPMRRRPRRGRGRR